MTGDFKSAVRRFQFGESDLDCGETGRGRNLDRRPDARQEINVRHVFAVVFILAALLLFIEVGDLRLRHTTENFFRFIDPRSAIIAEGINLLLRPRP